jgi:UDPglucose 6-dehydrogenase
MKLTVIGTGYLGATCAAVLAELGHDVLGLDTDSERVARLSLGTAPFREPGLDHLLGRGLRAGRLTFSTSYEDAAAHADVHFLCVGTPQYPGDGRIDLRYLFQAVGSLGPLLTGPCLVVGRSTVPVGTAERVQTELRALSPAGSDVSVAWNPEFLREAHAVWDSLHPDRLVFGVRRDRDESTLRGIYSPLLSDGAQVVCTDVATAELAKSSANVMLAARISLVNVLAQVCDAAGADAGDLMRIIGLDPRIGADYLSPGAGFGGGCLPKDTRGFIARAEELGADDSLGLLREVDATNSRQRRRIVEQTVHALDDIQRSRVAVLGAAFKAGSDDVRDSPALDVAGQLAALGAQVEVYDPMANDNARKVHPELGYAADAASACHRADMVLVLTEWPEFRDLDPVALLREVRRPVVLDARLAIDAAAWQAAGWVVDGVGRGGR